MFTSSVICTVLYFQSHSLHPVLSFSGVTHQLPTTSQFPPESTSRLAYPTASLGCPQAPQAQCELHNKTCLRPLLPSPGLVQEEHLVTMTPAAFCWQKAGKRMGALESPPNHHPNSILPRLSENYQPLLCATWCPFHPPSARDLRRVPPRVAPLLCSRPPPESRWTPLPPPCLRPASVLPTSALALLKSPAR